jgi:hypothetical protein
VTRETAVIELGHVHDRAIEPPGLLHASRIDARLWTEIVFLPPIGRY